MGTQMQLLLVVLLLLQLSLMNYKTLAQLGEYVNETAMTQPGCPYRCSGGSDVAIPYPFGIGRDCARDETFIITCNNSFNPPRPFITGIGLRVLSISTRNWRVTVENPIITSLNQNLSSNSSQFSKTYDVTTTLSWITRGTCNLFDVQPYGPSVPYSGTTNSCSPNSWCQSYEEYVNMPTQFPKGSSVTNFTCSCKDGYEGNPYLLHGCQDVDECEIPFNKKRCSRGCVNTPGSFICKRPNKTTMIAMIGVGSGVGTILFLIGLWRFYKEIKKRNKIKLKKKFFKQNGGLLLQKQLSSGEEGNVDKSKLFTSKELEKATDRYNKNRILGQGGQGTVYKGMLTDGRIVAIKVSEIIDEENIEQFINEVVILSQINHRNVVKLHGCCLETEVPLLVYEFVPNGNLFQYIHEINEEFSLSWDMRLRIATEIASALSYLHSAASIPIYHRDIKSTNILLDEKYKAKVADFGTSRSIAIDQTHLTTRVSGTFGYLDPEYFQSSQFTEKSDVYSFGVVLVELLTSEKPISSTRSEELRSLTTYFMVASKERRLFDIIDAQVLKQGGKEEITRVANLAKRCLNLSGRKRPTMREVMMELEGIRIPNGASTINEQDEKDEYDFSELTVPFETTPTSTASSDVHPLLIE
ncbi:hypothetical protein LguiA_026283 [Lonicera macranthoides]